MKTKYCDEVASSKLSSCRSSCTTVAADLDSNTLDCVPCDCELYCGSECGHSIVLDDTDPIYLCNVHCPCSADCTNRLSAPSVSYTVSHDQAKGRCLKACHSIPSATYIGDYTGSIVSSAEAETIHSRSTMNFILTIREESSSGCLTTHIDATLHGSPLRFMNHSCEPNVRVIPMRDNSVCPRATC